MELKLNTLIFHNVLYVGVYLCWYVKKVTQLKLRAVSYYEVHFVYISLHKQL